MRRSDDGRFAVRGRFGQTEMRGCTCRSLSGKKTKNRIEKNIQGAVALLRKFHFKFLISWVLFLLFYVAHWPDSWPAKS